VNLFNALFEYLKYIKIFCIHELKHIVICLLYINTIHEAMPYVQGQKQSSISFCILGVQSTEGPM